MVDSNSAILAIAGFIPSVETIAHDRANDNGSFTPEVTSSMGANGGNGDSATAR